MSIANDVYEHTIGAVLEKVKGLQNDLEDRLHRWVDRRLLELKIEAKKEAAQVLMDSAAADQIRADAQDLIS
jgi:DNA polymerase III delta subunit